MKQIEKLLSYIFAPVLVIYNRLVVLLYKSEDVQRREYQKRIENIDQDSFLGKVRLLYWKFNSVISPKKYSLTEQKDLAEIVRMSIKFGNDNLLPWREHSRRTDLRHFVRKQAEIVAEELKTADLHVALEGKNVFHTEYIALLKSAETTGEWVQTYDRIIASLNEKIKRRNAYIMIMLTPFFTLLIGVACEVAVALVIVPEMTSMLNEEDVLPPVTQSYANFRDILINQKLEWTFKIATVSAIVYAIFRVQATKYLIDLTLVQIPFISTLIARWEVSKFFQCINDMVKSGASPQESTTVSIGLINNRAIRNSMWKDVDLKRGQTSHLSEMFEDSVYIERKIRNQLKIATITNSRIDQLLDSIVEDYKESMKILLEAPMKIIMPFTLIVGAAYIFLRLVPLFNEVNGLLQNIGT